MKFSSSPKNIFRIVLIDPWRDIERTKVLLAGMLGGFGGSLFCLVLNYSIAGYGLATTITFQITRLFTIGMFFIGFCFWLMTKPGARFWLLLIQAIGVTFFLAWPDNVIMLALGYGLIASPFWAIYNYRFSVQQSLKNNGGETALSMFSLMLAGSVGTWMGGWLLQNNHYDIAIYAGIGLYALSSQILFVRNTSDFLLKKTWHAIASRGPSSRMSLFSGMLNTIQDTSLPAWFRIIGQSPLQAGTMLALKPILGFFFTPLIGRLIQTGTLRAIRCGGVCMILSWMLMAVCIHFGWSILPAIGLMACSANLIDSTEATRWFKLRSPAGIVARENLLALGRAPTFAIALPIAFLAPMFYPTVGIAAGLLLIFGVRLPKKKSS